MGGKGDNAENKLSQNTGIQMLQKIPGALNSKQVTDVLQKYGAGGMSLQDALQAMKAQPNSAEMQDLTGRKGALEKMISERENYEKNGLTHGESDLGSWKGQLDQINKAIADRNGASQFDQAKMMELFSNPLTAGRAASDQIRGNDLFKGMFGEGGIADQRQAEEKNLASRGYSLQPEDYEAYGQASDNIARMFGSRENGLAQALANRGLSSGASGAAGVAYSGLMGNKQEQLANQQRQIAQQRMEMNLQRLNAVRGAVNEANQQAAGLYKTQMDANQQGRNNYYDTLKDSANAANMEQGQENAQFQQREATKGPSFGDIATSLGTGALGAGLGTLTGGLGTGLAAGAFGGKIGDAIAGVGKKTG